jgi:hypothetical protein
MEMYDDELLDDMFNEDEDYGETEEEMLKRKAKMGIDASEDFSMDDFMAELDKFDPEAEEAGAGKSVRKRNWYTDEDSDAEKDFKFGDAPNQIMDEKPLRRFHVNPSEDEGSSSETDKLFEGLGEDKITVGDVKSGESEDDSFRRRTAEAKKKYPVVGKEERAKVSVKPVGKKGVEVEKTKSKSLSDIPDYKSEGDLAGIKRPERKGLPDKPEGRKLSPMDMSKLPSTKVPTKVPYSESELFKDENTSVEDDPLMDVLGGIGGIGKAALGGIGRAGAKAIGKSEIGSAAPKALDAIKEPIKSISKPTNIPSFGKAASAAPKAVAPQGRLASKLSEAPMKQEIDVKQVMQTLKEAGVPPNQIMQMIRELTSKAANKISGAAEEVGATLGQKVKDMVDAGIPYQQALKMARGE